MSTLIYHLKTNLQALKTRVENFKGYFKAQSSDF